MKRFFVTGTDTGVGKTFVTCALAKLARSMGKRVFAFKPIETGCRWVDGKLVGEDQAALVDASGGWPMGDLAGVHQYELPAAPRVAAVAEAGQGSSEPNPVSLQRIDHALARGSQGADLVVVEGAGGWRVPVTDELDMGGLAKRIGAPVVVVARATLGTINHSLLTLEAIERDGLGVAALVLSTRGEDDLSFAHSNATEIRRVWKGRVLEIHELNQLVHRTP